MKIALIICVTVIVVAIICVIPTIQSQRYEHIEKMQKRDYDIAEKQLDLEKEKVRYGK